MRLLTKIVIMDEKEKYVSRTGVSKDLLQIIARFGIGELRPYFASARNKGELYQILTQAIKWAEAGDFVAVENINQSPKIGKMPGFQSFEKAWKQLVACVGLPLPKFKNKYQLILDSVTFVEADIIRRLVLGRFDIDSVKIIYQLETEGKGGEVSEPFLTPTVEPEMVEDKVEAVENQIEGDAENSTVGETIEESVKKTAKKRRSTKK